MKLIALSLLLAGCGAATHAPTPRMRTFPERFGGSTPLQVSNQGRDPICAVYTSPTSERDWGEDWLEERERIAPNRAVMFGVQPGDYDVQVEACPQQVMRERHIDVHGARMVVVLGQTGSRGTVVPSVDGGAP